MNRSTLLDKNEYQLIIEIGTMDTKVGTSLEHIPFKIVKTPADVFFNPDFLHKDYFKLYNPPSLAFELRLEEFLYSLFFDEMTENSENIEVIVSLNMFVPNYIINSIENILKTKFQVSTVNMIPSQLATMYTSGADSGIIMDFGFSNITFIPFYKGFLLRKFVVKASQNGVTLFKKINQSVVKLNPSFENLDFADKIDLLNQLLVSCVAIPTLGEVDIMEENFEKDKDMMRGKVVKFTNSIMPVYLNYLESYRLGNFLFEQPHNIAGEFLEFLRAMPTHISSLLVNNIIPTGGLLLLNKFFVRFREELENLAVKDEEFKKNMPDKFFENFHFMYVNYAPNTLNWAGC